MVPDTLTVRLAVPVALECPVPIVPLPPRTARRSALGAAALLGLAACGGGEADVAAPSSSEAAPPSPASADGLSVVATTTVLADVARDVLGDAGTVEPSCRPAPTRTPSRPRPRRWSRCSRRTSWWENGGDLEESMLDALDEARSSGVPVFTALDSVETIAFGEGEHSEHGEEHSEEGGEHEHAAGSTDPHFWLDPARMAVVAQDMGEQLAEATGDASLVDAGTAYADELRALDASLEETLSALPADRRVLVTNHEAFGYFADRYDFEVAGTVVPALTTDAEPSAQDLEASSRRSRPRGSRRCSRRTPRRSGSPRRSRARSGPTSRSWSCSATPSGRRGPTGPPTRT